MSYESTSLPQFDPEIFGRFAQVDTDRNAESERLSAERRLTGAINQLTERMDEDDQAVVRDVEVYEQESHRLGEWVGSEVKRVDGRINTLEHSLRLYETIGEVLADIADGVDRQVEVSDQALDIQPGQFSYLKDANYDAELEPVMIEFKEAADQLQRLYWRSEDVRQGQLGKYQQDKLACRQRIADIETTAQQLNGELQSLIDDTTEHIGRQRQADRQSLDAISDRLVRITGQLETTYQQLDDLNSSLHDKEVEEQQRDDEAYQARRHYQAADQAFDAYVSPLLAQRSDEREQRRRQLDDQLHSGDVAVAYSAYEELTGLEGGVDRLPSAVDERWTELEAERQQAQANSEACETAHRRAIEQLRALRDQRRDLTAEIDALHAEARQLGDNFDELRGRYQRTTLADEQAMRQRYISLTGRIEQFTKQAYQPELIEVRAVPTVDYVTVVSVSPQPAVEADPVVLDDATNDEAVVELEPIDSGVVRPRRRNQMRWRQPTAPVVEPERRRLQPIDSASSQPQRLNIVEFKD